MRRRRELPTTIFPKPKNEINTQASSVWIPRIQSVELMFAGSPEVLVGMPFYFDRQLQITSVVKNDISAFVSCHMPLWFNSNVEGRKTRRQEPNETVTAAFFMSGPLNAA